jgi:hypothetical protein
MRNAGIFEEYDDLREKIYPRLLESAGYNAAILAANEYIRHLEAA